MSAQTISILVVDDDDAGRYVKAHVLRMSGYSVSECGRGGEAIARAVADPPDLILLDVKLPDMNGIEVCRRIKSASPTIVVLQTSAAYASSGDRAAGLEGGADSYLVEPIGPDELVATVNALLRMRKAEQDLRRLNETLEMRVGERTRELAEAQRRLDVESADRLRAEETLHHVQKLEAIGQLTGGVAHDFNNLLTVISASLDLIEEALTGRQEPFCNRIRSLAGAAQRAAQRGERLTRQLLAFARHDILRAESANLNEVIAGFEGFLRRAIGEAITVRLSLAPEPWLCRVDKTQFEAAILNLAVNARDAMPDGGKLSIETQNVAVSARSAVGELAPGDYVCVRIADSGSGMSPEVAKHAFEPFFTTKEIGRGTGLGLSQVYGFIKQSGGHVTLDSEPECGACFTLYLPRSSAEDDVARDEAAADTAVPTGPETVLIVEDDDELLGVAVAIVKELGYRILVASNGKQALELIASEEPIDLLFSDIVMPHGISGLDLARRAQELRGELRVLLTSGYPGLRGPLIDTGDYPFIEKPYRQAELARAIRAALQGAAK